MGLSAAPGLKWLVMGPEDIKNMGIGNSCMERLWILPALRENSVLKVRGFFEGGGMASYFLFKNTWHQGQT
jgi:hypothetical protein